MSLWLFTIKWGMTFLLSSCAFASSPTTATSNSKEEAGLLWQTGKETFDQKKYFESSQSLQRLVDHYPAHEHYLDSLFLLGKSYLEQKKTDQALSTLKDYIRTSSPKKSSQDSYYQAKLWLGDAYLQKQLYNETFLLALELEKAHLSPQFEIPRLLLKAQSLMGKQQDAYAEKTLASARKLLLKAADPNSSLQAPVSSVDLSLKLKNCAKFPSSGHLEEAHVIDQLNRRGTCLLEAMLLYKEILNTQAEIYITDSAQSIHHAFSDYFKKCNLPYDTDTLPQGKRSKTELAKHTTELSMKLRDDFSKKMTNATDLLTSWKTQYPDASHLENDLKRIQ